MKKYQACASCKHNHTKCVPDCPLAPYFPAHMHQKYRNAHKVFGGSHLTKFVKNLADSPHKRSAAMKHITAEADLRIAEPVGASFGVICNLRRNIAEEEEELRRLHLVLSVYRGVQGNIFDLWFVQVTTMVIAP